MKRLSCKQWRLAASCVEVIGVVLLLIAFFVQRGWNAASILGLVLILAGLVIHAAKFRCPACGRHISDRVPLSITNCPFCGAALEPEGGAAGGRKE